MPTPSALNFIQHKCGHQLCYAKRLSQLTQILVSWGSAMWKLSRHSQVSLWDSEHSAFCAAVLINRETKAVTLLLQGQLICTAWLSFSRASFLPVSLPWCMIRWLRRAEERWIFFLEKANGSDADEPLAVLDTTTSAVNPSVSTPPCGQTSEDTMTPSLWDKQSKENQAITDRDGEKKKTVKSTSHSKQYKCTLSESRLEIKNQHNYRSNMVVGLSLILMAKLSFLLEGKTFQQKWYCPLVMWITFFFTTE